MSTPSKTSCWNHLWAALINSQVAGLIMTVAVVTVFTIFLGTGPLYPLQVIASTFLGEAALQGVQVQSALFGFLLHLFVPCLAWGMIYGILAATLDVKKSKPAILLGVGVGLVGLIDTFLIVPGITRNLHGLDIWNREVPVFWGIAAHLVFGFALALYPKLYAWLENRRTTTGAVAGGLVVLAAATNSLFISPSAQACEHDRVPAVRRPLSLPFENLKRDTSSGLPMAVVYGDPGKGASAFFMKLPAGFVSPNHTHTYASDSVVIQGTINNTMKGARTEMRLGPGSYFFTPGRVKHVTTCMAGEDCIFYVQMQKPFDFLVAPNTRR